MIFMVFLWFHHENRLVSNFYYYIRTQHVNIRRYGKFHGKRKIYLFGTAPSMAFGSFLFENLIFLENNGLGQNCMKY